MDTVKVKVTVFDPTTFSVLSGGRVTTSPTKYLVQCTWNRKPRGNGVESGYSIPLPPPTFLAATSSAISPPTQPNILSAINILTELHATNSTSLQTALQSYLTTTTPTPIITPTILTSLSTTNPLAYTVREALLAITAPALLTHSFPATLPPRP